MRPAASVTLPCPRCGAALPVDPTAATSTCLYCRATVPVPPEMRRQALDYAARMGAVQHHADESRQALGMYNASAAYQKDWWKPVVGLFAAVFGTSILASVLPGAVTNAVLPVLGPVLVYGTMGYFGVRYYRAYQRAKQGGAAPLGVATSVCERCGGPLTFVAGSARAVCHACSAVAVAGRTIQGEMVSAAEHEARRLDVERGRSERAMYRTSASLQGFTRIYMYLVMGWPVLALVGVGLVGGTYTLIDGLVSGRAAAVRGGLVLLLVGAVAGVIAGGVGTVVYTQVILPARAGGPVLRALAARLGGNVTDGGPTAALDWLDARWGGPAPSEIMIAQQEMARYTLATAVEGLPALVVVLGGGAFSRMAGKRLHVLVAAPRTRDERAALAQPAADLRRFGFEVKVSDDGVALSREAAEPAVVNEASLGWVLRAAAALART